MMVGRDDLRGDARAARERRAQRGGARGRGTCNRGRLVARRQLQAATRARSSASPGWWARAAPRWRAPFSAPTRSIAARSSCTASRCASRARRRGARTASATCPRTASATAWPLGMDVRDQHRAGHAAALPEHAGLRRRAPTRQTARSATSGSCAIKTPSASQQTVQNLSGGNQQKVVIAKWLTARLRHPDLRRADPRHRRRRQERDLQAAERPGRAGQGDRHDLVRAARRCCA